MKPVLIDFGEFQLYSFGFLVAAGILVSLILMLRLSAGSKTFSKDLIYDLVFVTVLSGFLGGRLLYVIQFHPYYLDHPLRILFFWEGGLIFYGGLIGSLAGIYWFCRSRSIAYFRALDFLAPFAALAHAFGRFGCFLNGCCLGGVCDLPWAVQFPGQEGLRHPAQLYEMAADLIIFAFLYRRLKKPHPRGQIIFLYLGLYAIVRFFLEWVREPNPSFGPLTQNQWISLLLLLICAVYAGRRRRHNNEVPKESL